jgi:hypothetical protein
VLAAVLGVAVAGSGLGGYVHYRIDANATCLNQGATIVTHQGPAGECVGITDGSYQFDPADPELTDVENAIKKENEQVTAPGSDYASLAYLLPISAGGGVQLLHSAVEQLEGAYVAQYYANRHDVNGIAPRIQLLIANDGTQGVQYGTAVHDIERAVATQHLVAVAGLGVSISTTAKAIKALASAGIPLIGSSITSDTFDNIKGLVRVSPSNHDEVSAVLSFIKPKARTAVLIEDTNASDSYDATLVQEFSTGFPDARHAIVAPEIYNTTGDTGGSSPAATAIATRINQMPADICLAKASVVLFAGRGRDLATLLSALADRPCLTQPVTIATGDDVTNMPITRGVRQGLASGVALYYAGNANPAEWSAGKSPAIIEGRQGFTIFSTTFTRIFPDRSLNDGNAMMGYDATLTSVSATRLTTSLHPGPAGVLAELSALQGAHLVLGASGPIVLRTDYRSRIGSNPVGKAIPILRLEADGSAGFVQLDWPEGHPPAF